MSTIAIFSLALRDEEVWQCLLMLGIDLHQDHVLRIVPADNQLAHQCAVGTVIETAQVDAQVRTQTKAVDVLLRRHRLVSVERRKGLQLDELGFQPAFAVANQSEVHLHKHRSRRFVGNVVFRRDRLVGNAQILRAGQQLHDQLPAVLRHLLEQCLRYEDRCLGDAKAYGRATGFGQRVQKALVLLGSVVPVELLAQCGDHAYASIRKRPFSMICRPSTQMSNRVPTTSMCVLEYHCAPVWCP